MVIYTQLILTKNKRINPPLGGKGGLNILEIVACNNPGGQGGATFAV